VDRHVTTIMRITELALDKLKQRIASSSNAWGIRLSIKGGGCGGYTYEHTFEAYM